MSSDPNNIYTTQKHELNLFSNYNNVPSRATAGTTNFMPGQNSTFKIESHRATESKKPILLPITCGYFYNIVR